MAEKKDFTTGAAAQFFGSDGGPDGQRRTEQRGAWQGQPYPVADDERRRRAAENAEYISRRRTQPREKPDYFEARSKRVNIMLKPSLYAAGAVLADRMGISYNHLIELALTEYTESRADTDGGQENDR